jgi:hypothetical protein
MEEHRDQETTDGVVVDSSEEYREPDNPQHEPNEGEKGLSRPSDEEQRKGQSHQTVPRIKAVPSALCSS